MKENILMVKSNNQIAKGIYELKLQGATCDLKPGQFIEISLDNFYLRRPFSVADYDNGIITILYKVAGQGTDAMTKRVTGEKLNCLTELGNGFCLNSKKPLLIGGGIGIAPLYYLAKTYKKMGIISYIILGFKNEKEIFYIEQFKKLGNVFICTDDGSCGIKGNILDALKICNIDYDYYHACGPNVMLKNLQKFDCNGQISLEARMGCGFGACMGCSINTTKGIKRVCKEGPVFETSEVIF